MRMNIITFILTVSCTFQLYGDSIGYRRAHTSAWNQHGFYIWAGIGGDNPADTDHPADTWLYDGSGWIKVNSQTPQSYRACSAVDPVTGLIYSYGGKDATGNATDQFHVFNPASNTWTEIAKSGNWPPAIYAGCMTTLRNGAWGDGIIMTGGTPTASWTPNAQTWIYDTCQEQWFRVSDAPEGVVGASLVNDSRRGVVVLFGGRRADSSDSNTIREFSISSGSWSTPTQSGAPDPRMLSAFCEWPGVGSLFSCGMDGDEHFADLWLWDGSKWYDTTSRITGNLTNRFCTQMGITPDGTLLMYGGEEYAEESTVRCGDTIPLFKIR